MNVQKLQLIFLYSTLVRKGKLLVARKVFQLLKVGYITLGINDIDWEVELWLERKTSLVGRISGYNSRYSYKKA